MMEALRFTKKSILTWTTRRNILNDGILHTFTLVFSLRLGLSNGLQRVQFTMQ
jgi:hypothetical protein